MKKMLNTLGIFTLGLLFGPILGCLSHILFKVCISNLHLANTYPISVILGGAGAVIGIVVACIVLDETEG